MGRPCAIRPWLAAAAVLATCALAAAPATAQNRQTVIALDSELYGLMRLLYIEQGLGLPSQALPWSVEEAEYLLARIAERRLSTPGRLAYERIRELLGQRSLAGEEGFAFNASVAATLESYWNIGAMPEPTDDAGAPLDGKSDILLPDHEVWEYGFDDRRPFLRVPLQAWLFDTLYAHLEFELREEPKTSILHPETLFNVPADFSQLYLHFPFRAFLSVGGPHWSVQFGRDTLSWGNGLGGNLMLSDYAGYLDFVRATTWWRNFKFTTVYAGLESWLTDEEIQRDPDYDVDSNPDGPELYKAFFGQRFEWRLFDTVGIAVTEGMIFGRKVPDPTYLNPLMFFHNWFEKTITNINGALELEWTPAPGLALYGQYVLDQWQTPVEKATYPGASSEPDSFGWLLGLQAARPLGNGWLEVSLEWIHSNPWLYTQRFASPLLSYTVRRRITAAHRYLVDRPLGWKYGPDADSKTLALCYRVPGRWEAALTAELRVKGGLSIADLYPDSDAVAGLSGDPPYDDPNSQTTPTGDYPDRRFVLTASGMVRPLGSLEIGGSVAWVHIRNPLGQAGGTLDHAEIIPYVSVSY